MKTKSNSNKVSPIHHNEIPASVIDNTTEMPIVQSNTSCLSSRKREFIWILFSAIATILIPLATIITTIVVIEENIQANKSTMNTINTESLYNMNLSETTSWKQNGITIAGGNGKGDGLNQLHDLFSIYIYDDQTIYIADSRNHRIMKWKCDAKNGEIVAGGNGQGNKINQLAFPIDVLVDKESDSLIICELWNRRIMRWPRQNGLSGEIIIFNIECYGLAMDNEGYLYYSDMKKSAVKRWKKGNSDETIVAGANGKGNHLNQLYIPTFLFVDQDHSIYVSDTMNNRVMKWTKGAKEGIVVAGGQGYGKNLSQLCHPMGIFVDQLSNVYVSDTDNHRVMRWIKGAAHGSIVVGGNEYGKEPNQFFYPIDLSMDHQRNLYVVDYHNHRVQKFYVDSH